MKRVFSTPQNQDMTSQENCESPSPPDYAIRPSGYVRQITEHHQSTIARIFARVQANTNSDKQE